MSIKKSKSKGSKKGQRMSREEWLVHALEALEKEGGSVLSIDALSRRLGVSRGSFYWHFKDRTDFIRQLVDYWATLSLSSVDSEIDLPEVDAKQRLLLLMEAIVNRRLARYDIAIRAWASRDTLAEKMVKKVDEFRLGFVSSLFAEIGFEGDELKMRARTLVGYFSLEPALFPRISHREQLKHINNMHALFTRLK